MTTEIKQIIQYFFIYKKHIGSRLYIVFLLAILAALTEGLGIAMLLPLISASGIGVGKDLIGESRIHAALSSFLETAGIGNSMIGILLVIALLFVVKGLIIFMEHAYQAHLQSQLVKKLKNQMFAECSQMKYEYYCSRNTGYFINVINRQTHLFAKTFQNYKHMLATLISAAAYIVMGTFIAWKFSLMALIAGAVLLLFFRKINNHVHNLSRQTVTVESDLNKFLVQTFHAYKYLLATAELDRLGEHISDSVSKLSSCLRSQGIALAASISAGEPISVLFIISIIIIQVNFFKTPLAPIFVAIILFNRAMTSILGIQVAWQTMLNKMGSLEAVEEAFEEMESQKEISGDKIAAPLSASIDLENVSFSYSSDSECVLKDVSLQIKANSTVAFVGDSGAGKSTLADMLTLALRPSQGEIYIDKIPGPEIENHSWREQIGYVSQETIVFDDTIANNISLWREDYNNSAAAKEKIEFAAKQSYAAPFIQALPKGYNTVVGDRGIRLSGGQRQRLFLARELYKKPRLLILDEATSALDSESEQYIQKSIDSLSGQITVVLIAHRLSTVKNAYIYVLDQGKIAEHGIYASLLSREGSRFGEMVKLQKL